VDLSCEGIYYEELPWALTASIEDIPIVKEGCQLLGDASLVASFVNLGKIS
jgi:hypothetical protein